MIVDHVYRVALAAEGSARQHGGCPESSSPIDSGLADEKDDLTRSFVRLSNLPSYPLDRLSRYETTLWRQACQVLFTLRRLNRRGSWKEQI
jgi:hypothetical protein